MAACNQCPQDGGDIFPNLPSYARANAEYYNYCSLWWWELYARNRMESLASCECFESQSGDQVDRLCECSFRKDEYSRPGACCADNSCYGTLGENWKSSVWTYDQRFDNNCGWNQFPIAPKGRQSGRRPKGSDYGNHIWNGTQRYCDNSAGCDENLPYQGSEDPETIEMDVNEDFRKFLEQSKRYREERDKAKQENKEGEEDEDYIEVGSDPVNATSSPPTKQQGLERKQAMEDLYGQHSEHILALETALQLNYDRNCDTRQPIFWPNIPLKF